MRTIIASCVLVVFSLGVVVADDIFFTASKIEKKGDSYAVTGKKKAKKGEEAKEMTFTIDAKVKVSKGKGMFDKDTKKFTVEVGDEITGGLGNEMFKDVSTDKTVGLYLTTDGDKVSRVLVMAKKKKKTE